MTDVASPGTKPIASIVDALGILPAEWTPFGKHAGKVSLDILKRLAHRPDGKLVLVTAITPTPFGEGKTTTTIGLGQGMARIGANVAVALRQPSLGPVFGVKGGGTGGGKSLLFPMDAINMHFTGDIHAVSAAHNLASAFLDNHLHHGNALGIDPSTIRWPRVVDVNDRAIRRIVIGLGGKANGVPREDRFDITTASEVMAVLALAEGREDLRARLGRIRVASTRDGKPVTCEDIGVAGAMAALLRDAIEPNLAQTCEGVPAFVHAGPFANIAHGNSSVLADRIALKVADYVLTEAGFGADMGAEKFVHVKCRQSGLKPAACVLVATIRALKMHAGVGKAVMGKPLDEVFAREDVDAVRRGGANLAKHIENMRAFGLPVVVAINAFPTDTPAENEAVKEVALAAGAKDCILSTHFAHGGAGAEALARALKAAADEGAPDFRMLYDASTPLVAKIETLAKRVYGAEGIDVAPAAARELAALEKDGFGHLPICMAKTQSSLSHDPNLIGRPSGFRVPIREVRLMAGAGFVTVLAGDIMTMPGLPSKPAGLAINVAADGTISGLF